MVDRDIMGDMAPTVASISQLFDIGQGGQAQSEAVFFSFATPFIIQHRLIYRFIYLRH